MKKLQTPTIENITFWHFTSWKPSPEVMTKEMAVAEAIRMLEAGYRGGYYDNFHNVLQGGVWRNGGWAIDLKPYLNEYLVRSGTGFFTRYAPSIGKLRIAEKWSIKRTDKIVISPF